MIRIIRLPYDSRILMSCINCNRRPKWQNPADGTLSNFCGMTCMNAANSTYKPQGTLKCGRPDCNNVPWFDPVKGKYSEYCGNTCRFKF